MYTASLDLIPLWCFLLLTLVAGLLAVEGGYRYGRWRHSKAIDEKEAPVAAMVAAVLGLLAFMLAFTFGLAASRYDERRQGVLDEANAIGTTYLRSQLLVEPERTEIADLLRRYTELRTQPLNLKSISHVLKQSEDLQTKLWSQAISATNKAPSPVLASLFLQSLNETIDLHSKRVFVGLRSRIPISIWVLLFVLTILGMSSVGYQAGLSGTRRSPEMPLLAVAFAGVLFLIVDLDRGHEGLLKVGQEPMVDLLRTMQPSNSPSNDRQD